MDWKWSGVLEESTGGLGVQGVLGWVRREKRLRSFIS